VTEQTSSNSDLRRLKLAENIFARLTKMYGSVFVDMWSYGDPAEIKQCWADELVGYTAKEVMTGITACKGKHYPPTLPAFLMLCRRPVDPEAAFYEASRQMALREAGLDRWENPALYWAAAKIGAFDMRNGTWGTIKRRWTDVLDDMLMNKDLPPVPERMAQLPAPGRTMVKDVSLRDVLKASEGEDSSKAWAHRVFERYASGELITEYAVLAAEHALGQCRPEKATRAQA
jgi:hypothetical protein